MATIKKERRRRPRPNTTPRIMSRHECDSCPDVSGDVIVGVATTGEHSIRIDSLIVSASDAKSINQYYQTCILDYQIMLPLSYYHDYALHSEFRYSYVYISIHVYLFLGCICFLINCT